VSTQLPLVRTVQTKWSVHKYTPKLGRILSASSSYLPILPLACCFQVTEIMQMLIHNTYYLVVFYFRIVGCRCLYLNPVNQVLRISSHSHVYRRNRKIECISVHASKHTIKQQDATPNSRPLRVFAFSIWLIVDSSHQAYQIVYRNLGLSSPSSANSSSDRFSYSGLIRPLSRLVFSLANQNHSIPNETTATPTKDKDMPLPLMYLGASVLALPQYQ
jgi:hypothetical protein